MYTCASSVILRAAAVKKPVADFGGEGINGPLRAVGRHYIAVGQKNERPELARAFDPGDEIQPRGVAAQRFALYSLGIAHRL